MKMACGSEPATRMVQEVRLNLVLQANRDCMGFGMYAMPTSRIGMPQCSEDKHASFGLVEPSVSTDGHA